MNLPESDAQPEDADIRPLLTQLAHHAVPSAEFQRELTEHLRHRLSARSGDGALPEGWALCPFDRFCLAEIGLPRAVGAHCPCLHTAPLLRLLKGRAGSIHARPCAGLQTRDVPDERPAGAYAAGPPCETEKEGP